MGGAVLIGLLNSLFPSSATSDTPTSTIITTFIATTKSAAGAEKLKRELGRHAPRVQVLASDNQAAMEAADIVVLGVKPFFVQDVLREQGVKDALEGKFVISIIAGKTVSDIRGMITDRILRKDYRVPFVAKAIPNVAARYRQSMTIFEQSEPALPQKHSELLEWIFSHSGTSKFIPEDQINNAGMLITNCLASMSVPLEGLLDGSVVGGLRRGDAMDLAIQGLYGLAAMLENGIHPGVMRESISSPKGSTIQSLMTVEKGATRAVFAQAQIDGTNHLKPAADKSK